MDTPTPDAESVTPAPSDTGRTIKMVPQYLVDEVVIEAAILSFKKVSEGLMLGFENLEEEEQALNQIQKTEMLSAVMFCLRDIEEELRSQISFAGAIHDSIYGETRIPVSEKLNREFSELFEFDPSDPTGSEDITDQNSQQ